MENTSNIQNRPFIPDEPLIDDRPSDICEMVAVAALVVFIATAFLVGLNSGYNTIGS